MFVELRLWGVQCVWGNATTMYLLHPQRGLCCQPLSELEVISLAETILVTDNSYLEGRTETASCSLRRTYVMDYLLSSMEMFILWRLGKDCRAGRRFCWRSACKFKLYR